MQSDTTHYGFAIEIYAVQGPSRAALLATWPLIGACWGLAGPRLPSISEISLIHSNEVLVLYTFLTYPEQ